MKKTVLLKIAAQTFEAGDFLNIFLRFWGFGGSFSYKTCSYKRTCIFFNFLVCFWCYVCTGQLIIPEHFIQ